MVLHERMKRGETAEDRASAGGGTGAHNDTRREQSGSAAGR